MKKPAAAAPCPGSTLCRQEVERVDHSSAAAVRHAVLLAMYDDRERVIVRSQEEYRALFPGFEQEVDAALALLAGVPAAGAPRVQDDESRIVRPPIRIDEALRVLRLKRCARRMPPKIQ